MASQVNVLTGSCTALSGNSATNDVNLAVVESDNTTHIRLSYSGGAAGTNLTVEIYCDSDNMVSNL
jgi:hypothetical protein